jgi:DNA-binding NarL/FixJ family response regulator
VSRSILLADDSAVARRVIRNLASDKLGDTVTYTEAADGLDALERASQPDVVVLDIAMPGLNGVEAASRIIERCPKSAVLAISNYDVDPIIARFRQAGIRGFVPKASIGFELIPAIEALLQGRTYFTTQAAVTLAVSGSVCPRISAGMLIPGFKLEP